MRQLRFEVDLVARVQTKCAACGSGVCLDSSPAVTHAAPPGLPQCIFWLSGWLAAGLLQQIPLDGALRRRCDEGKPLMSSKRESGRPAWQAYMKVAERVSELLTATPCASAGPKISMT